MKPRPPFCLSPGRLWLLVLYLTCASGCGSMHFSYHALRASRSVEQAKQMSADEHAPYQMELANLYLEKAHEEAGEAEYLDAVELAREATRQAITAVQMSLKAGAVPKASKAESAGSWP